MNSTYISDYFYYSQEMTEATRRIEALTNPMFVPGSMAGVACLTNIGGQTYDQKEKRELPEGKVPE